MILGYLRVLGTYRDHIGLSEYCRQEYLPIGFKEFYCRDILFFPEGYILWKPGWGNGYKGWMMNKRIDSWILNI